jgi:hypothetical protein
VDGAGALPFFLLDAHEEAATPDRLFLFGKARAAPAPCMRRCSAPLQDGAAVVMQAGAHIKALAALVRQAAQGARRVRALACALRSLHDPWAPCVACAEPGSPDQARLSCKESEYVAVFTHSQVTCTHYY